MGALIDRLQIQAEHLWLDDEDAALYTGFSTGHFQQRIICQPDRPALTTRLQNTFGLVLTCRAYDAIMSTSRRETHLTTTAPVILERA